MLVLLSLLVLSYLFMASGRCCSFKWTLNLPDNIRSRSTTLPDKEKGPSPPHKRTQHCWPTTPNIVGCYMLRPFAHHVPCCCVLLGVVVAQSLKPVKLLSQQLPTSHACVDLLQFARSLLLGTLRSHGIWLRMKLFPAKSLWGSIIAQSMTWGYSAMLAANFDRSLTKWLSPLWHTGLSGS